MTPVHGGRRRVMPVNEDVDSALGCRERRRRRIEMRRRIVSGADNWEAQKFPVAEMEDGSGEPSSATVITNSITKTETPAPPVYGSMAVVGRAREMEDEISIRTNLCRPELNGYLPVHFFAVFDGHGGHHVSALCKENMHVIMAEELTRVKLPEAGATASELEKLWQAAIDRSFERMDEMAMSLCGCDGVENSKVCRFHPQLSLVGSTAVVSLLTEQYIIVANCGDSRAVISRTGKAVPLSLDHKPEREDERARIEACGGRIVYTGCVERVEGVLAMTRAIGDKLLKHVVISKPECMFMKREVGDRSLIIGSDGLWDVLSNELCCELVHRFQQEDEDHRVGRRMVTIMSAAMLVRLAIGRGSCDNVSVVVVDLRK